MSHHTYALTPAETALIASKPGGDLMLEFPGLFRRALLDSTKSCMHWRLRIKRRWFRPPVLILQVPTHWRPHRTDPNLDDDKIVTTWRNATLEDIDHVVREAEKHLNERVRSLQALLKIARKSLTVEQDGQYLLDMIDKATADFKGTI